MTPRVLVEWTLSDGTVSTFEMSQASLSELRYNSAKVLAEMVAVHGHPVMKIT